MKRNNFWKYCLHSAVVFSLLLSCGCKSDVDFSNIDKTAEVQMALALPVGTMSATINDFIGNDSIQKFLKVNAEGVLQFDYLYQISRPFTDINLAEYMSKADTSILVNDKVSENPINGTGNPLPPIVLPIMMKMDNCNTGESIPEHGRIDSMYISTAHYVVSITPNDWSLPKEYVSAVKLVLGDRFRRQAGKTIDLDFEDFGKNMEIDIDDFYINLLNNKNLIPTTKDAADDNVVNQLDLSIQLILNIPSGMNVPVSSTSSIKVETDINVLRYNVLWGYFIPGNKMREKGTEDIGSDLKEWAKVKKCQLMLAKPRIDLTAATEFTAPLNIKINEVSVTSKETGATEKAHFQEGDYTTWHYITPAIYNQQIQQTAGTSYSGEFHMTEDPVQGDLARLFRLRPDSLTYDFNIDIDYDNRHLQHRMTPDPDINLDIDLHVPLSFNKGMELNYADTLSDVTINFNFDSIIDNINLIDSVKASDLKIRLRAESTIPLDVKLGFAFLDSLDQAIDFSGLIDNDTLLISAPKELLMGVVNPDKPGVEEIIINVSKEEFSKIHKIKKIVYDAYLMTNNQTFDNNPGTQYVSLLPSSGLKLNIAASANLDALLNLDFNNNK